MSLKLLKIDEGDLGVDVLHVDVPDEDEMSHMELPDGFDGQEIKDQVENIANLSTIATNIALEGIDSNTAREIDALLPGFYTRLGGGRTFTPHRTIEGLKPALEAINEGRSSAIERFIEWLKQRIVSVVEWLRGLIAKNDKNAANLSSINDFLASQRRDQIYDQMDFGNKSPEDMATQFVARMKIGGDNVDAIKTALAERFKIVEENVNRIRQSVNSRGAYNLVISGSVTVGHTHIDDFRQDMQQIMDLCGRSLENSVVGSTISSNDLEKLTEMVDSAKKRHAITLSTLQNSPGIKIDHYSLKDIKNNLQKVNTVFSAAISEDVKNTLRSMTTMMQLMGSRDRASMEINSLAVDSVKPIAEAISLVVKFVELIDQVSSASAIIGSRLVRLTSSYKAVVQYAYKSADEESKKNIESFAKINGIPLAEA